MAFDFKQSAQNSISNSFLQAGRIKMSWNDIDNKVVTIIGVDKNLGPAVDSDNNIIVDKSTGEVQMAEYTTTVLEEYPDKFLGGFFDLDRIISNWLDQFKSAEECTAALKASGGVKIRAHMNFVRGKNRRTIEIL